MLKPVIHNILNQPTSWKISPELFLNEKKGGFKIRIEKGFWKYRLEHPFPLKLSLFGKIQIYFAIRKWKSKMLKIQAKKLNRQAHTGRRINTTGWINNEIRGGALEGQWGNPPAPITNVHVVQGL